MKRMSKMVLILLGVVILLVGILLFLTQIASFSRQLIVARGASPPHALLLYSA
jgi:hypothetical protein